MNDSTRLHSRLEAARGELLDKTMRNRLINTRRTSTRSGRLEIIDERADEIFRLLVQEKKALTFLPRPEDEETAEREREAAPLAEDEPRAPSQNDDMEGSGGEPADSPRLLQPDEDEGPPDSAEPAEHHLDNKLQTELPSEKLQKRLLKLFYDARTFEEEQGVNTLYLAVGFLKWFEDDNSDTERFAPLLLLPVKLDRSSANARFRLRYTDDDITTNLSLQEKLREDFGLRLPDVPDVEELSPTAYFDQVRRVIETRARWQVLDDDMVLWFFSFAKFLMYRDLHPEAWAAERPIEAHPLVSALMQDGFRHEPPICPDSGNIDPCFHPADLTHVLDADSSQTIAIEEIRQGRNLVVQGPPGTGKSQTIANLIATAVSEGKKVLFVAEKMAALEVVKRRLDNVGLGEICLELHSHKANKRAVLQELERTLSQRRPKTVDLAGQADNLCRHRDMLNRHAEIMHSYLEPAHVTPHQALGELVRLRAAGVEPADFELVEPLAWSKSDVREKQNMLEDLAVHLGEIGDPRQNPWRGVQVGALLPMDIQRLAATLPDLVERLQRLMAATDRLAELLDYGRADTLLDGSTLARFARRLGEAPTMDRRALAAEVWKDQRPLIDDLLKTGAALARARTELRDTVIDQAWETDVATARWRLAAYGRSWFRIFNGDYRRARATLRAILRERPPKSLDERLNLLDRLIQGQKAARRLGEPPFSQLGPAAFGSLWRGADSDFAALERIAQWERACRAANLPENFRQVAAAIDDQPAVDAAVKDIAADLKPLYEELKQLFARLELDLERAFGVQDIRSVSLRALEARLQAWAADREGVTKWIAYHIRWRRVAEHGMAALAERIEAGEVPAPEMLDRFQMAYYEQIMRAAFAQHPELAAFDGVSHEQLLAKFKRLDLERIELTRQQVALAHYRGLPTRGGDAGEVGLLRREMKKKRRHLPLRQLLGQAGHAVQAVKPVFMMSPISVAQYLEPGVLQFDLLLIDEASQVRPVEALGAVARARQMAVVGDERQLPPTQFFDRVVGDDGRDPTDDDFHAGDLESILGLCEGQNMPSRMLRWHYRSRHHSLIALSNHEFYENNLYVVPSPFHGEGGFGLRFHHVADGVFDRGRSRTNRREAIAIAEAVMEHAASHPDKTLGVGAFSVAQRDAILDEIELRRRQAPELESFFATGSAEPFFVKNLENIQGDERDVILISVGYARDESGFISMNFGPLNAEGGERRLNVLITRARERCEVYSSITADDIDLARTRARGAQALKSFLSYARTGFLDAEATGVGSYDSEFERQVGRALKDAGFEVHAQIGVAGFFIDLGIVDPERPGRYLLGIECDGASYHSARSARDRDRLRQQVLEDRGWIIHRIWSTDWFNRPEDQLRKVLESVERAKAVWASRDNGAAAASPRRTAAPRSSNGAIDRHEASDEDDDPGDAALSQPYEEADFPIHLDAEIHDVEVAVLAEIVSRVVEIEGPVHQDEVARRTAYLWGLSRVGSRIAACVEEALAEAVHQGRIAQQGLFHAPADQAEPPIRNREDVGSANLRKAEYLPPAEIRAALIAVIAAHLGMTADEAATRVARLLGFRSTGGQLRQAIQDEIDLLLRDGELEPRGDRLYLNRERTPVGE